MKRFGRTLCCLVVFTTVLMSVASLTADWLNGSAPTQRLRDAFSLLEAQHKGRQLSQALHVVEDRCRTKDQVIDELRAGKLNLFQAATLFRSLYQTPRSWCDPRSPRPEWEDGESWCRLVIDWAQAKVAFETTPSQGTILRQNLEDVLDEHLRYHCGVELPD